MQLSWNWRLCTAWHDAEFELSNTSPESALEFGKRDTRPHRTTVVVQKGKRCAEYLNECVWGWRMHSSNRLHHESARTTNVNEFMVIIFVTEINCQN